MNGLQERENAINIVKEVIPAAFWFEELNPNGRIKSIHYSDEIRTILGYTYEQFPDTLDALLSKIHPDDRRVMLDAVIAAGTGKAPGYNVEYRVLRGDGRYMWANATGMLIKDENGVPEGMYGAFIDISEKKVRQRDMDVMDILTSEYDAVFYVDLIGGEATPYSKTVDKENNSIPAASAKFTDVYTYGIEGMVCDADKARMLSVGTVGNIMKELRNKKAFSVVFRDKNDRYSEMKCIKMGKAEDEPEIVAMCFAEKDEQLRTTQESSQKLQRNFDIIGILASEYTSVYYIDMDTDELDTYTMNETTEDQFGDIFRAGINYSDAFKLYVDKFVSPQDKEKMLRAGSRFTILDELADKKTFITGYVNSDGKNCEMKFVKVGDAKYPKAVALGFSEKY